MPLLSASGLYVGADPATKAYIGADEVWSAGPAGLVVVASVNTEGAGMGTANQLTNIAFLFVSEAAHTIKAIEILWGTGTIDTASGTIYIADYFNDPGGTPLSTVQTVNSTQDNAGTWERFVLDSPFAMSSGVNYALVIKGAMRGLATRAATGSTAAGIIGADRFLWGGATNTEQTNSTGAFRFLADAA